MVLDVTLERMATHPKQYRAAAGRHTHTRQGHPPERSPGARKPEKKVDLAAGKKDRGGGEWGERDAEVRRYGVAFYLSTIFHGSIQSTLQAVAL